MKKIIYLLCITVITTESMNFKIPPIPNIQMPTLQTIASLNLPDLSSILTNIQKLQLPDLGNFLNNIAKLSSTDLKNILTGLSGLSQLNLPNIGTIIASIPTENLTTALSTLNTISQDATSKGISITAYLATLPADQYNKIFGQSTNATVQKINQLRQQLATKQQQLQQFQNQLTTLQQQLAQGEDPTGASDAADLAKLEAQLKTVQAAIVTQNKGIPALQQAVTTATGQLDSLNKRLENIVSDASGFTIDSIELGFNLADTIAGKKPTADITYELQGKKKTASILNFDVTNTQKAVADMVDAVRQQIETIS